jgi:hypothetical protein
VIKGKRRYSFASVPNKNVDVLQAIAAISGRKSRARKERHCWKLSIGDHSSVRGGNLKPKKIIYNGDVVCLSVLSSFVLVRDGGTPVITGQCNFGFPGGLGAETFIGYAKGHGIIITKEESQNLKNNWFQQWPEMHTYFKHVNNLVGNGDSGVQEIPQSGFRRGNCGYCDTANGYFQTLAAHASKEAMWQACKKAYYDRNSALYGSRLILFIHDELIFETPEEAGHEAAQELERTMVEAMQKWTPDVPAEASATLMHRWSKSAESVYENEKLIPWDEDDGENNQGAKP